jgi:hypothetical protein
MAKSREKMMDTIQSKYPNLFVSTTESFDGSEGGIWMSGEDGTVDREGLELFNYYAEDYKEKYYIFGVRKHFHNWTERNGWCCEWHDAGTIMMYQE